MGGFVGAAGKPQEDALAGGGPPSPMQAKSPHDAAGNPVTMTSSAAGGALPQAPSAATGTQPQPPSPTSPGTQPQRPATTGTTAPATQPGGQAVPQMVAPTATELGTSVIGGGGIFIAGAQPQQQQSFGQPAVLPQAAPQSGANTTLPPQAASGQVLPPDAVVGGGPTSLPPGTGIGGEPAPAPQAGGPFNPGTSVIGGGGGPVASPVPTAASPTSGYVIVGGTGGEMLLPAMLSGGGPISAGELSQFGLGSVGGGAATGGSAQAGAACTMPNCDMNGGTAASGSGTTAAEEQADKPADKPKPKAKPRPTSYTVRKGDTLASIAKKFGVTTKELKAANKAKLKDGKPIFKGMVLKIPKQTTKPAATSAKPATLDSLDKYPKSGSTEAARIEFLQWAARQYGANGDVLVELSRRVSKLDPAFGGESATQDPAKNAGRGLLGFVESTFKTFAARAVKANPDAWKGLGDPSWLDWRHQSLVAAWAIKNGYASHWSAYDAAQRAVTK